MQLPRSKRWENSWGMRLSCFYLRGGLLQAATSFGGRASFAQRTLMWEESELVVAAPTMTGGRTQFAPTDLTVILIVLSVWERFPLPKNRRKSNNREAKRLPYGQGLFFDRRGGYHPPVFFVCRGGYHPPVVLQSLRHFLAKMPPPFTQGRRF